VARVTGGIQQTGLSYGDSTANIQLDGLVELIQNLKDYEAVHLNKELVEEAKRIATPLITDIKNAYPSNPLSGWGGSRTPKATTNNPWGVGGTRTSSSGDIYQGLSWNNAAIFAGLQKRIGLKKIRGGKSNEKNVSQLGVGVKIYSRFLTIIQQNAAASVFEFAGGVTPNSNLAKGIRTKFGSVPRKPMWRSIDANLDKIEVAFKNAVSKTEDNFNRLKSSDKKGLG
jgi:hypothetical protein